MPQAAPSPRGAAGGRFRAVNHTAQLYTVNRTKARDVSQPRVGSGTDDADSNESIHENSVAGEIWPDGFCCLSWILPAGRDQSVRLCSLCLSRVEEHNAASIASTS